MIAARAAGTASTSSLISRSSAATSPRDQASASTCTSATASPARSAACVSSARWVLGSSVSNSINWLRAVSRSEEHTSELQSLMRISYAVFCLKKKKNTHHLSSKQNTTDNH